MIIATDITNWMSWWVDEVVYILTACFTMLDSIQFAGTSVLKVILGIMLLSAFLPVILTLLRGAGEPLIVGSERMKEPTNRPIKVKGHRYEYFKMGEIYQNADWDIWFGNSSKYGKSNMWGGK